MHGGISDCIVEKAAMFRCLGSRCIWDIVSFKWRGWRQRDALKIVNYYHCIFFKKKIRIFFIRIRFLWIYNILSAIIQMCVSPLNGGCRSDFRLITVNPISWQDNFRYRQPFFVSKWCNLQCLKPLFIEVSAEYMPHFRLNT